MSLVSTYPDVAAIAQAIATGFTTYHSRRNVHGCCRVYVAFGYLDIHELFALDKNRRKALRNSRRKTVIQAVNSLGKLYYSHLNEDLQDVLYVGYDNLDGSAIGQAYAIVDNLASLGVSASVEYLPD
jgi:predicted N-acyltransferase